MKKSCIQFKRWHATPDAGTESEWFRRTKSAAALKIRDVIALELWKQRNKHGGRCCKMSIQDLIEMTGMSASALRDGRDKAKAGGVLDFTGGEGGRHQKTKYWLMENSTVDRTLSHDEKGSVDRTVCANETVQSVRPKLSGAQDETLQPTDRNGTVDHIPIKKREEKRENNRGDAVVDSLADRGVKPPEVAEELAAKYPTEQIEEVCTACDLMKPGNPGGWIRKALEDGYDVGDDVRDGLKKARSAKERDRAVERFKAMSPAERESIIESIREAFPGIALKIKPGMNSDELLAVPAFRGALYQVVRD